MPDTLLQSTDTTPVNIVDTLSLSDDTYYTASNCGGGTVLMIASTPTVTIGQGGTPVTQLPLGFTVEPGQGIWVYSLTPSIIAVNEGT